MKEEEEASFVINVRHLEDFITLQFGLLTKQSQINGRFATRARQLHPTPVFLPGESHGWRSLAGCSPWGHKESDTSE